MKFKLTREFKIGLFGIMMLGCLYWGINFLKGTDLFASTTEYYAVYDQVNGLQPSASIVIKGFKVGSIKSMSYDPKHSENIVLEFAVKSKYKIPKNSRARIFSDGLMGGKSVEIELGDSNSYLSEGDTLFSIAEKGLLEVAGSEFEYLKQRAGKVFDDLTETMGNLNAILSENRGSINTSMTNVASITGELNGLLTSEQGSMREIVQNLNALSKSLKDKSGQIDNIINNAENFSDSLSKSQIPTMIAEMTKTLNQLNITIAKVNQGEGTVGKFMTDKSLYDSLVVTTGNLSALLDDIKRNPKRYINVSVFGGKKDKVE